MAQNVVYDTSGGNGDIRASGSGGTLLVAGGGNDVLRGGIFNDTLYGGQGNDLMLGGAGADKFVFYGTDVAAGKQETDQILDLDFGDGDTLVFNSYDAATFVDAAGGNSVNVLNGGSSVIIDSIDDIVSLAADSAKFSARGSETNNILIVEVTQANGSIETILLNGLKDDYLAAGGVFGV